MDPSIRQIQTEPTRPLQRVHRERPEGDARFDVDDDADREPTPEEDEDEGPAAEDLPVAPRPEDEAGSHLDVTA